MMRNRRAFTLIELLTVMAISAILLGIIIFPLYQSFNLTREAQAFSDAQDRARILSERIGREIGNAYSVRGGTLAFTRINGVDQSLQPSAVVIRVPKDNGTIEAVLPYTKLDLVQPAEGDQSEISGGGFHNPVTGMIDPTLRSPKGQVVLPVAPGFSMIRYFVALRDPALPYNDPYDGLLMQRNSDRDNLYLLYRADVQPYVRRAGVGSNGDTSVRYRPNLDLFESDSVTDTQIEYTVTGANPTGSPDVDSGKAGVQIAGMDDPRFATMDLDNNGNVIQNEHNARVYHWVAGVKAPWETQAPLFSHGAVVQTEISRYDMIVPQYDLRTRIVRRDAQGVPALVPLIQFRPEKMSNELAVGRSTLREGDESTASAFSAPDVYMTKYGQWGAAIVRTYPRAWDPSGNTGPRTYQVGLPSDSSTGEATGHFALYYFDPATMSEDVNLGALAPYELFDLPAYTLAASNGGRPFTAGVVTGNTHSLSTIPPGPGMLSSGSLFMRQLFTPYTFDASKGRIVASFGISEVGGLHNSAPYFDPDNLPFIQTSATAALTPSTDPSVTSGVFSDPQFGTINEKFNKIYHDFPELLPDGVERFIDARVLPTLDGTLSPLFPNWVSGEATNFVQPLANGGYRNRVQITPGSEIVTGPDQLPGPHFGMPIQYTRITTGKPGPNQYLINYADLPEPIDSAGNVTGAAYEAAFGLTEGTGGLPTGTAASFNPNVYSATNFISAVLQPRFKVGYIHLNSDPNVALPFTAVTLNNGNAAMAGFRISYRFQFTGAQKFGGQSKSDTFAVDYDSRQLMSVLLTIRNYPQSASPNPQSVTLKSTAKVRNYTR